MFSSGIAGVAHGRSERITEAFDPWKGPCTPLRILYIGEIVGSPGVYCIKTKLAELKEERSIDFVIACGDGATGGFGIGKNHSIYLHKLGVDSITSGECIYYKKDMVTHIVKASYVLRPANYPYGNPGRGWNVFRVQEQSVGVVNLLGQSGFNRVHLNNPFLMIESILEKISTETKTVIVDFHATTTAEKYTMFYYLDGKVSAVLGSHTKVLTADARVFPGGTAVMAGTGRTGSQYSVGGLEPEIEIRKFLTQIHEQSRVTWKNLELQGVIVETNEEGKAVGVEIVREACEVEDHEGTGHSQED
ncbi:MAG: YmdB family metallophosphoesterase [Spirochaetaceae bacterium]|nr:MAG: YmdB family metallophosphoesterase [Spirochaetaceae bacterium]